MNLSGLPAAGLFGLPTAQHTGTSSFATASALSPLAVGADNSLSGFFGLMPENGQGAYGQFQSMFSMLVLMLFSRMGQVSPFHGMSEGLSPEPPQTGSESTPAGPQSAEGGGEPVTVASVAPEGSQPAAEGTGTQGAGTGDQVFSPNISVQDGTGTDVTIRQLSGAENGGRHHIYVRVLDADGNPAQGEVELINANGDRHVLTDGGNLPMWRNDNYTVRYNGAEIKGVDSHSGKTEPGSDWGHQSYEIVFREKPVGESSPPGNLPESQPENPSTETATV